MSCKQNMFAVAIATLAVCTVAIAIAIKKGVPVFDSLWSPMGIAVFFGALVIALVMNKANEYAIMDRIDRVEGKIYSLVDHIGKTDKMLDELSRS